jgi:hypothetical protein
VVDIRTALRLAVAGAALGWAGLLDTWLSSRQVLERTLSAAERALGDDGRQGGLSGGPKQAREDARMLEPVLGAHGNAWLYGRGFLDVIKGQNFVPWWLATAGQRERFAALNARIGYLDELYRPDPEASRKIIASVNAWLAVSPVPEALERVPAAPKWILYADTSGALHPLHARLREAVVGRTADSDTYFAVPLAHHWTRVRWPDKDAPLGLSRMQCFDAVDLLVGRTEPFEVLGVVPIGPSVQEMVAQFKGLPSNAEQRDADAATREALLKFGIDNTALDEVRAQLDERRVITEPIDAPESCVQVAAPMEGTFGSWLNP